MDVISGMGLPFSRKAGPADLDRLARDLVCELALPVEVRILSGDGAFSLAAERRFRLGWWTTGDEALRAALHRAKTRVYQHAKATGTWQTLTRSWEVAEHEIRSDSWRQHLRNLVHELPQADTAFLRLAFRAAQQAASRLARWRSVLADVPSPFSPLVELFAHGAWPLGCRDGELWLLVWSSHPADRANVEPGDEPDPAPVAENRRLFLSAPFRERALSAAWQTALEERGWRVVHGPVREETRAPEVQLAHHIREADAVLGLLGEIDPDFGLPWWMFQELDYACACARPVALIGRGHLADPELPGVHRIDAPLADPAAVLERHPVRTWFQGSPARLAGTLLAVWIAISWALPLTAQAGGPVTAPQAPSENATAPVDAEKLRLEREKLTAEREKLQAERDKLIQETQQLRDTNAVIGGRTRFTTTWAAAVGSIFGALVALIVGFLGFHLNRTQRDKLEQERAQERVNHLLEIFRDLGSEQPRIRMGAVAILVQKIEKIRSGKRIRARKWLRFRKKTDPDDEKDLPTIVSTLIIATKYEEKVEIQKQIADGLAQALEAVVPEGGPPVTPESPFKPYDFQGARLENAWWKRVDARGVDFYKACLARAGLRQAFLCGAVLKKADLRKATLAGARLDGADLTDADLRDADLRGADFTGATLFGAKLDRARLEGANLTTAKITDIELRFAKTDATTLLPPPPAPGPPPP